MKYFFSALILLLLSSSPAFAGAEADKHFDLALNHLASKEFPQALEELKATEATLAGDDKLLAAVYANRGIVHANLSQTDDAIDYFKKSLAIENRVPRLHLFLGRAYLVKGRNRESVESFLEATKIQTLINDPKMPAVDDDLWRAYAALGRQAGYDREIALREIYHLEKAVEKNPVLRDEPSTGKERKFLVAMIASDQTPESKGEWPDDGIPAADKQAALTNAKTKV